ncbi:hypothetical protein FQA39_LY17296 [Lamprigera yunnana]|nr:hypothetical protein FQA39_LY17296 [Lamprigera yunnana]
MWMLYAEQHSTKAIDLKSAVESLYEKLGASEFDADHEAIYVIERSMDIHKQVGELRLTSEFDLQWLPPSYLKHNTKSTEITEAWEKLPLDIRNNEEMKTYLLYTKDWNLPSWECQLDGLSPQKRKCVQCTMFRINESVEMYSIYEAESWRIATNAYSAIERMRRQFTALAFKADHETVYGLGRWNSEAYLQYLVKHYTNGSARDHQISVDNKPTNLDDLFVDDMEIVCTRAQATSSKRVCLEHYADRPAPEQQITVEIPDTPPPAIFDSRDPMSVTIARVSKLISSDGTSQNFINLKLRELFI